MKEDIIEDLLVRYILNEADAEERRWVEAWLQGADDHIKRFEQTRFLLDSSTRLAEASPVTEQEAWEEFKVKREASGPVPVKILKNYTRWLQAAAAVLLLAAGSWAAWHYGRVKGDQWTALNAYGKVVTDTLPDGTVIQLNKNAAMLYNGRTVRLKGEAFFRVVHRAGAPFKVYAQGVNITDIGTAFNVKADAGRVEVIVESGLVRVNRKASSVQLKQGQMLRVEPGSPVLQPEKNSSLLYQYYRTDEFVADHTPLNELVKVLNEAYGANIQIEGKGLAGLPITATFKKEPLDKILQVLMLTTPEIHRVNQGNVIIITR